MRVLVCGSRNFKNEELMEDVLKQWNINTIIEGEARGADLLARSYAERQGMDVLPFPALWDKHGRAAGALRNAEMLRSGKPDLVVAFWDGESRGTQNMINQAEKAGVPIEIIKV